jgi:DNA primase
MATGSGCNLADAVGVSFQQVQKYEEGTDRIKHKRALVHLGHRPLKLVPHVHGTTFYHKGRCRRTRRWRILSTPTGSSSIWAVVKAALRMRRILEGEGLETRPKLNRRKRYPCDGALGPADPA